MDDYALLEPADEDALHAPRLFNFEEKHFKRLTKRVLNIRSLRSASLQPTPDATNSDTMNAMTSPEDPTARASAAQDQKWVDEVLLDFASFDSNIVRAQLLLNSNERERDRYAQEKLKIQDTAATVRENNIALHEQLKEAQRVLEARKGYDKMTEKITANKALKTRDEQKASLDALQREIAELKAESQAYAKTWAERRDQFGKIVEEGTQMLRLIRDEKEEAERKEGMDDDASGDEQTPGQSTRSAVPTPTGGSTPLPAIAADQAVMPHTSHLRDETVAEVEAPPEADVVEEQNNEAGNSKNDGQDTPMAGT